MKARVGIRGLLLAVNAFALVVPLAAIVLLRIFDNQLIRQTESQLIAQAVLIGETWREAWLVEAGFDPDAPPRYAPTSAGDELYFPWEPELRLNRGVLPPTLPPDRYAGDREGPAWRAGETIQPVLQRAVRMNLASVRVLDAHGCVVASSGEWVGACLEDLPEIAAALTGRYGAALRDRPPEGPQPPLDGISRRSRVRVYSAIPILSNGEVIGVVRLARTALDPVKALWFDRARLLAALAACALLTAALSLFLSRTIARPLRAITADARSVARGERRAPFDPPRLAPEELRDLSHALDRMTRQLSDRADYIADFAANVSHELKNPISGIRGAAELLAHSWRDMSTDDRDRFIANIEGDAERMERLVTRLLQLARIQSAPERAEELDLRAFLEALAHAYGEDVELTLGALPDRLRIHGDHLDSAVRNLVDNGVRHSGGWPVELAAQQAEDRVVIRVRDRGPGISPRNRDRVFERFFTTERDHGGTGLGLAIARAVAETRGGRLGFTTGPEGSCFELVL